MLDVDDRLETQENSQEVNQLKQDLGAIMADLSKVSGLPANSDCLVTCRLNQTGAARAAPIWCGWVEKQPSSGSPELGKLLGKNHVSPIYQRCFNADRVVHKIPPGGPGNEKVADQAGRPPLNHDAKLNYRWRAFICVKDNNNKKIGTLTVGFKQDPTNENQVEDRLKHWAQGAGGFAAMVVRGFNPSRVEHP